MTSESTSYLPPGTRELQTKALTLLRDDARRAHLIGDGFLVNHLCSIALHIVTDLNRAKQLKLTLREVYWAIVLSYFWLVDLEFLRLPEDSLQVFRSKETEKQGLHDLLQVVHYLIEQPLDSAVDRSEGLKSISLEWLGQSREIEATALVTLAAELVWYRNPTSRLWLAICNEWSRKAPSWLRTHIDKVRTRLLLQSHLVDPTASQHLPDATDSFWSSRQKYLYEGWVSLLNCDWEALDRILAFLIPRTSFESPSFTAVEALRSYSKVPSAPVAIEVTRNQLKRSRGGISAFRMARNERFGRLLSQLWRHGKYDEGAHLRFKGFSLGMLDALGALREWDVGSYFGALRRLADANLEVARLGFGEGQFAVESICKAVQSRSFKESDDLFKRALSSLDFESVESRHWLVNMLLHTRPIEQYSAHQVFESLSDSIPQEKLLSTTKWYVDYVNFRGRRNGWTFFPIGFWGEIIPFVDESEQLCSLLAPALFHYAEHPGAWQVDKHALFTEFLVHAPLGVAIELAETMMRVNIDREPETTNRWNLIYNAVIRRQDLANRFKKQLIQLARDEISKFYAQYLKDPDVQQDTVDRAGLHDWLEERLDREVQVVIDRKKGDSIRIGGGTNSNVLSQVRWTDDDLQLVEKLIKGIDSPMVQPFEITSFLQYLAVMVEAGSPSISSAIVGPICRWLHSHPLGNDNVGIQGSPFSGIRMGLQGPDDVASELAFLCSAVALRLSDSIPTAFGDWVIRCSFSCSSKSCPDMLFLAVVLGIKEKDVQRSVHLMSTFQVLLLRALEFSGTPQETNDELARGLRQLCMFMNSKSDANIYYNGSQEMRVLFLTTLKNLMPTLERYRNPNVRAAAATILRYWREEGSLPNDMDEVLSRFKNDARARVRYQARLPDL